MAWQDVVMAIGGFIFWIALIPSVSSDNKPSKWTALMTALVLTAYLFVFASLEYWLSFVSGILTTTTWYILLIQKIRSK